MYVASIGIVISSSEYKVVPTVQSLISSVVYIVSGVVPVIFTKPPEQDSVPFNMLYSLKAGGSTPVGV